MTTYLSRPKIVLNMPARTLNERSARSKSYILKNSASKATIIHIFLAKLNGSMEKYATTPGKSLAEMVEIVLATLMVLLP